MTKVEFQPLYDRVLVQRVSEEEMKKGLLIIPDTAKEKPMEGVVVAVGAGAVNKEGTRVPLEVQVGDKVLFGKYAGTEIKLGGEDLVILREDEVLGKMREGG